MEFQQWQIDNNELEQRAFRYHFIQRPIDLKWILNGFVYNIIATRLMISIKL